MMKICVELFDELVFLENETGYYTQQQIFEQLAKHYSVDVGSMSFYWLTHVALSSDKLDILNIDTAYQVVVRPIARNEEKIHYESQLKGVISGKVLKSSGVFVPIEIDNCICRIDGEHAMNDVECVALMNEEFLG